jgi:hypothetical protein
MQKPLPYQQQSLEIYTWGSMMMMMMIALFGCKIFVANFDG